MKPTAAYLQHHPVEPPRIDTQTFRPGWRVTTRLDQLRQSGAISAGQWQACVEYRRAWEAIGSSLRVQNLEPSTGGGADLHGRQLFLAITMARIRAVEDRTSATTVRLAYRVILEDVTWAQLGRQLRCDWRTARVQAIGAVRRVAVAWGIDGPRNEGVGLK